MIGTILGARYELAGLLSDGPIFAAYSARDRQSGRDVCVRVVKPPFGSEAQFVDGLAAVVAKYRAVSQPGIETISDVGRDGGSAYMVGELTRGPTLGERIRKLAPFSVPVSVGTAISICHALDALHRAGLVHGDVGGQNLVVMANGEVRLQLAGIWEAYSASPSAGAMVLPAMAPYLAPEVSSGGQPSRSSDVYAVGVLLYELLAGRQPYYADTPIATAMKHASTPTPRVRAINPSAPAVLDEIVAKAMAKDPRERYATAGELLADLKILQDALRFGKSLTWPLRAGPTVVKPREPQPVAPRMSAIRDEEDDPPRHRQRADRDVPVWMQLTIVALGAVLLSLLGVWLWLNLDKPREVTVPNIRGLSVTEARNMLGPMKLQLRIGAHQASDTAEPDRILDTDPPAGQKVREGGRVTVTVSSGSTRVEVPDLKGMTEDKAKSVLNSVGLDVDPNTDQAASNDLPEGQVVRQSPAPRTSVDRNTLVHLTLSNGNPVPPSDTPAPASGSPDNPGDNADAYVYTLKMTISDVPRPVNVRVDIDDSQGTRPAYRGRHDDGDKIQFSVKGFGPEATFSIYYDDQLVKEFTQPASEAEPLTQ